MWNCENSFTLRLDSAYLSWLINAETSPMKLIFKYVVVSAAPERVAASVLRI